MARYPREEISYKKVYKKLDIDKSLGIIWPVSPNNNVPLDLAEPGCRTVFPVAWDEFDEDFCKESGISPDVLMNALKQLNDAFNKHVFTMLDGLLPVSVQSPCDICGEDKTDEDIDDFAACNGCGISVHKECYGIPTPMAKYWFCTKCLWHSFDGHCFLCPEKDGILKLTDDQQWVHALCAVLHPNLSFANLTYKDPVDTSELKDCKGVCNICRKPSSKLIKCTYAGCAKKYHTSCAAIHLYCDLNNKCIYCPEHDFADNGSTIISRRSLLVHRNSYPDLENDVLIRSRLSFTPAIATEFTRIISSEPFCACPSANINDAIINYWIEKRKAFGTVFSDQFLFSNYLNEAHSSNIYKTK